MKTKTIIGMSLLALGVAGMFTGCATQPVGEISQSYYQTFPNLNGGIAVRQYQIRNEPALTLQQSYRPYSIEPVGERMIPANTVGFGTLDGQLREPVSPYGPNSPCVRSLWW